MADGVELQIDFERNQPDRFFQINGPVNQSRSCTARVILSIATSQPMDIALQSARQQVSFINQRPEGQLLVRSQFRLGSQTSGVRAFQLVSQNTPGTGANPRQIRGASVQLNDIGLRTRATNPIEVRSVVQLQVLGMNDGAVRVRNLGLELRLQAVQDGAGDPGDLGAPPPRGGDDGLNGDPEPVARAPRPSAPAAREPEPEPVAAPTPMAPAAPRAGSGDPIGPAGPDESPTPVAGASDPAPNPGLDTRGFAPR
jgi:hypothetical protein